MALIKYSQIAALQQVFTGLWPSKYRTPDDVPIIHTRNPQDENLFPNDANCRRFNMLARAFAKLAADTWRDTPEMEYLNQKLGKWMPEGQKVAVDGVPKHYEHKSETNANLCVIAPETLRSL